MERTTSQKEIIFKFLEKTESHPSAEEVYAGVKKKKPRISRATVYRNLKNLKNKGRIQEIPAEVSHYDGNISSHAHFLCQKCGRIFDVFEICQGCGILRKKKVKVGEINKFKLYLYGYCRNCKRK
ncbi:MAG: transcriptional repressor [Candidatus Nealsonbacteria bacterium]|nr:transcriptional repressor [Candidatus Nealsonbacteria bacterium]